MAPEVILVERTLGRLATWLRLLGLDAPLVERLPVQAPPGTALLTRRRALAGRPGVVFIEPDRLPEQLAQVVAALDLRPDPARFHTRCLGCNLPVLPITREQAAGLVPDFTLNTAAAFTRCPGCGKVFWPGSHGQRARAMLEEMLGARRPG